MHLRSTINHNHLYFTKQIVKNHASLPPHYTVAMKVQYLEYTCLLIEYIQAAF